MSDFAEPKSGPSPLHREPRHLALVRDITAKIQSGELQPGDQLPSFNELRERWGVGRDTLERMYKVLERDGLISREHRRGIFVSRPGQTKKQGTIGFMSAASLLKHPYYVHLLEGIRSEAERAGIEVTLLSNRNAIRWERVDGVIYQTTVHEYLQTPPGIPRVVLVQTMPHLDSAVSDDYVGMAQAMEHLLSLGHRRIAMLSLEGQPHSMSRQRTAAYRDTLQAHGIALDEKWIRILRDPGEVHRHWEAIGYEDTRRWLSEDWKELGCTAILAHNDETAIGVIAALQESGLRVPEDVSVVGFDGTEIARYHRPRITTVKVPLFELGAAGFGMLLQQIERSIDEQGSERLPKRLMLPTQFQPGETTARANSN